MKAYSLDLRERVAAACQQPGRITGAVAARFSVSVSFVEKLLQRQSHARAIRGCRCPRAAGPPRAWTRPAAPRWWACLRQQPDATLDELRG